MNLFTVHSTVSEILTVMLDAAIGKSNLLSWKHTVNMQKKIDLAKCIKITKILNGYNQEYGFGRSQFWIPSSCYQSVLPVIRSLR